MLQRICEHRALGSQRQDSRDGGSRAPRGRGSSWATRAGLETLTERRRAACRSNDCRCCWAWRGAAPVWVKQHERKHQALLRLERDLTRRSERDPTRMHAARRAGWCSVVASADSAVGQHWGGTAVYLDVLARGGLLCRALQAACMHRTAAAWKCIPGGGTGCRGECQSQARPA